MCAMEAEWRQSVGCPTEKTVFEQTSETSQAVNPLESQIIPSKRRRKELVELE